MKHVIAAFLISLLFGCNPVHDTAQLDITASDIASALQMNKWVIEMPSDVPANKRLGLELTINNDVKVQLTRLASAHGKTTTLLMWNNDDPGLISYRSECDGSGMLGDLKNDVFENQARGAHNTHKVCAVGDTIFEGFGGASGNRFMIKICLVDYVD